MDKKSSAKTAGHRNIDPDTLSNQLLRMDKEGGESLFYRLARFGFEVQFQFALAPPSNTGEFSKTK